ncbi:unnamed protein product [Ceutorhynchus assimilis]|uniref:MATH domain-containing protein n=1 Tax=Ceutorhynchus assimilis TaxID=467358 RepID=A0A9N9MT03_9CUCU|nr:unnamed protein product [Ceutorhynchus assimilis]
MAGNSDDYLDIDHRSTGSQKLFIDFYGINSMEVDEYKYSHYFTLCNSKWCMYLERKFDEDKDDDYMSIFLQKVDDERENQYSFHVQMTVTLLSYGNQNISRTLTPANSKSRYVFGKRSGESMNWGFRSFILWDHLLLPRFIAHNEDNIQFELDMTIIKIYAHGIDCGCEAC